MTRRECSGLDESAKSITSANNRNVCEKTITAGASVVSNDKPIANRQAAEHMLTISDKSYRERECRVSRVSNAEEDTMSNLRQREKASIKTKKIIDDEISNGEEEARIASNKKRRLQSETNPDCNLARRMKPTILAVQEVTTRIKMAEREEEDPTEMADTETAASQETQPWVDDSESCIPSSQKPNDEEYRKERLGTPRVERTIQTAETKSRGEEDIREEPEKKEEKN